MDAENRAVPFHNDTLRHYSRMWYAHVNFFSKKNTSSFFSLSLRKDFRPDSVIFERRIGHVRGDAIEKWQSMQEMSSTDKSTHHDSDGRVHVCMYFSDKMDGMKAKLLGVIRSLPDNEFRFTFFACRAQENMLDANYTNELYTQLSATGKEVNIRGII